MSILSDREIIDLSARPTHLVEKEIVIPDDLMFLKHTIKELVISTDFILKKEQEKSKQTNLNYNYRLITEQDLIDNNWKPMIENFTDKQIRYNDKEEKIISYGVSSYGYDLRCGYKFKIFTNVNSAIADPKHLKEDSFVDIEVEKDGDFIIIPPNSFALTYALEKFNMPKDITGVVLGKSTYARVGVNCLATPAEAGWSGHLTLEFSNTTPLPVKLYAGEGCCQVLFFRGNPCITSYADRNGKYQNQGPEVVLPRT